MEGSAGGSEVLLLEGANTFGMERVGLKWWKQLHVGIYMEGPEERCVQLLLLLYY